MQSDGMIELAANIVVAYVANNRLQPSELPALISTVHSALSGIGRPTAPATTDPKKPTPAQIRQSITPDAVISFEDGKSYKTLKRHLARFGLTPAAYREKWGLPGNYPMIAANYSAARAVMAKSMGLGTKRDKPVAAEEAPARRSRKR